VDLNRFSPQQCAAITAGEGPLSILAGPGSGKTTTLAGRIAYLVGERHVPPTSILAITFTTAAAAALRRQLQTVLGDAAAQVDIRTFHSFGLRVIRSWSEELGFGNTPPAVYGREDARAVLREAARELGLAVAENHAVEKRDAWAISLAQLDHALERYRLRCANANTTTVVDGAEIDVLDGAVLAELAAAYERRLKSYAAVDYPSMLTLPLHLLEANSRALHMLQDAYRWILVDEYQDCCRLQASLLQQLTSRHHNLTVVGDPFQSIYRFRGADPRLLVDFPDAFAGAQVLVLEQNYRSTRTVVALANSLVAPLGERPASWTANPVGPPALVYAASSDADEARFVAAEVARLLRAGELSVPGQAAVLFRTNAQARELANAFRTRGIPVQMRAELDLLACAEVKDLLAYLRLAHSPLDSPALARVINTPSRRLRSIEHAFRAQPVPIDELPECASKRGGSSARAAVERFLALLDEIHSLAASMRPEQVLDLVLDRTAFLEWMGNQANRRTHLDHVRALRDLLAASDAPDLGTWLADLHLGELETGAPDSAAVPLLTIHGSKGREWPVVFIAGCEEGLLPFGRSAAGRGDDADRDEERRLAYVAMSRSQVQVYLTWCRTRLKDTNGVDPRQELRQPSRFVRGLPPELVQPIAVPKS
jgi:DNA helicase II / ATP-dependent DNA helicase PcrA